MKFRIAYRRVRCRDPRRLTRALHAQRLANTQSSANASTEGDHLCMSLAMIGARDRDCIRALCSPTQSRKQWRSRELYLWRGFVRLCNYFDLCLEALARSESPWIPCYVWLGALSGDDCRRSDWQCSICNICCSPTSSTCMFWYTRLFKYLSASYIGIKGRVITPEENSQLRIS